MKMEKQAMLMGIKISVIFINSQIDPSISPSIGPNNDLRFRFQTYVPGFGFGSDLYPNI